jgi:hypothetical protein
MPTYTLFRHKSRPQLRCAVPVNQPLPDSLEPDMWEESGTAFDERSAPPGFQESAARYAFAMQGFYIFRQRTPGESFARLAAAACSA